MTMKEFDVGDTFQVTWINSNVTPTDIHYTVHDGSESLVDSGTMISSGNGHYYGFHTPNSFGFFTVRTVATIAGLPFKRSEKFKAILVEVD